MITITTMTKEMEEKFLPLTALALAYVISTEEDRTRIYNVIMNKFGFKLCKEYVDGANELLQKAAKHQNRN